MCSFPNGASVKLFPDGMNRFFGIAFRKKAEKANRQSTREDT